MNDFISRAEFGETLYHAITLFSGRQQVRHLLQLKREACLFETDTRMKDKIQSAITDLEHREKDLTDQIMNVVGLLEPADAKRLLDKYEAA